MAAVRRARAIAARDSCGPSCSRGALASHVRSSRRHRGRVSLSSGPPRSTTSAPMARASDTGTGFTSAPSTRMPSSVSTGVNSPGMASDARTAASVDPVRSQTSAPVSSDVATAANGIARSSIGRSWKPRPTNAMNRWPLSRPPVRHTSMNDSTSRRRMPQVPAQNRSNSPVAYAAPTSAPTEVPQTMSGRTPARSSARTTPTCAQPRAAPLPSTSPSRGARRVRANRDS